MSKNKEHKAIEELETEVKKAELVLRLKHIELETMRLDFEIRKAARDLQSANNPEITT